MCSITGGVSAGQDRGCRDAPMLWGCTTASSCSREASEAGASLFSHCASSFTLLKAGSGFSPLKQSPCHPPGALWHGGSQDECAWV